MAVSIFKNANGYKINGNSEPSGVYRALYSSNNTFITIVSPEVGNRSIFPRTLITEILKEDGVSTYADFNELDTVLADFFKPSGIGGQTVSENTIPIGDASNNLVDSLIIFNPTLDRYESGKDFFAPTLISNPGSIEVGDSIISSGGREISARSTSTGNQASFTLQLFDDNNYEKSTTFDENTTATLFPLQTTDDTVASGIVNAIYTRVIQIDTQFMRIRFKPQGGIITAPFTFSIKIDNINTTPSYKETVQPTDPELTDLGGGVWELKLNNPLIFDAGFTVFLETKDISLLGGNGFMGPNIIGDPTNNYFFPFTIIEAIPIVRHEVLDQRDIIDEDDMISDSDTQVPTQQSVKAYVDASVGIGDMTKAVYDPTNISGDAFDMDNMVEGTTTKIFTDIERSNLNNQSGTNSGDIILASDTVTDDTLDLSLQELTVNVVTQTTYGAMDPNDKLKLDNISDNGTGDHWVSGLDVTEQSPKDQTVNYTAGTYLINGIMKTVVSGGIYDLENGFGSINHYTGLTSYQHRFVTLYVDDDEVIKSVDGLAVDKKEVPPLPTTPSDSVPIALIEIKVDSGANPKDIKNKEITDTRNAPAFNTDEFVRVSADDLGVGHLSDKLSNNGNVTFTIENAGGIETIKADAPGGGTLPSMEHSIDANIDGLDVTSIAPNGILYANMAGNRELRSFSNGVDNQMITLVNIAASTIKVKNLSGIGQMIRTEGSSDKTFGDYGGATFVYKASTGYWYIVGIII